MRTAICLLLALLGSGCVAMEWRNVQDPDRDFGADRDHCERTRGSSLGVTHCLRQKGWDAE